MANAEIDNMGRRQFRRVLAKLGLTYDTPPAKVEEFVEGVKEVIRSNPSTRKDYFHVVFNEYEASALQVMVYFFLKVPDWTDELLQKEAINLEILKLAERIGVSFAFPTQSLHIESLPEVPNSHQSSSKEI